MGVEVSIWSIIMSRGTLSTKQQTPLIPFLLKAQQGEYSSAL